MHSFKLTSYYTFHGVGIAVSADHPRLAAAIHSRLRLFAVKDPGTVCLAYQFYCVPDISNHLVERPPGTSRLVYDPPVGEVVYVDSEDQLYISYDDRVRALCDPSIGQVQVSILPSEIDNLWLLSHPIFTIPFVESLKRRRLYSLHAAGLQVNGKGVLLPGGSGAGKSTLTIALLRAGFGFLGDDITFLAPSPKGLRALAFPDEIDVTDGTISLIPQLEHLLSSPRWPNSPKHQVLAEEVTKADCVWECRPAVLVFPRVSNTAKSILSTLDRDAALLELAPNILLTDARSSQAHFDALADLVRSCDCYRLETGRDFDALPSLFRDLTHYG